MRLNRTIVLLLVLATPGCAGWRRYPGSPAEALTDTDLQVIRVTRSDASRVDVYQPRIVRDTLTGLPTERAIQRVNIPMADITAVATRHTDLGRTLLAGLAIAGGVVAYSLLQSLNTTP